jgi:diaminohydroxyphosphoribosylaminopyrimidine deaminase/5-amino-6-(5-phosphoribosylamino)uracil reductase
MKEEFLLNFSQQFLSDSKEEQFIKLCVEIAKLGEGSARPNPLVGSVVVKKNRIVGIGYHKAPGLPHAERIAIDNAGKDAEDADLYVNLEPCVHFGRTPPCVDYIIEKKIKRVFIGTKDPNPVVNGKGIEKLKRAGIKVKVGILEDECRDLNRKYFVFHEKKKIFVALKLSLSLDGKIANYKGLSKWISSKSAREYSHKLRGEFDLIGIGSGTLLNDNPSLFPYLYFSPLNPIPLIVSTKKIPFDKKIFKNHKKVFIATSFNYEEVPENVEIIKVKEEDGKISLKELLKKLYERGFQSIMFEGGSEISSSLLKENLIDEYHIFITPFIIGDGISPFKSFKLKKLSEKKILKIKEIKFFDETIYMRLL